MVISYATRSWIFMPIINELPVPPRIPSSATHYIYATILYIWEKTSRERIRGVIASSARRCRIYICRRIRPYAREIIYIWTNIMCTMYVCVFGTGIPSTTMWSARWQFGVGEVNINILKWFMFMVKCIGRCSRERVSDECSDTNQTN